MKDKRVILVSAGLLKPKKEDNYLNKRSLYPNYGLISLATVLKSKGYLPTVIHGDYEDPQSIIELMYHYEIEHSDYPILLSLPSFFSISWAKSFCEKIHINFKSKKIVVGGKWVVSGNENWIKSKLSGIDCVISQNAESIIESVLTGDESNKKINLLSSQNLPKHLDYTIVHNYKNYQPSVELARGCGCNCSFCLEKDSPYELIASPEEVVLSLLQHQKDYNNPNITPYFQTSFFKPTMKWCNEFHYFYNMYNLKIKWRTQTRIDSMTMQQIKILAKSGLKVLDLGLESASPSQILRMGKSKSPEKYLKKASLLLKACYENNIWTKINILFYAGETLSSIRETQKWLESHSSFIKGLSINPLFIYKYTGVYEFIDSLEKFGASLVSEDSLESHGYAHLNLSSTIDFNEAKNISMQIRQKIVSDNDYFDLKAFSYFNRYYTFDDFRKDFNKVNNEKLPFHF
jgi:radical SAM superfamily enzyme YgiQ (UPF0313 family)